MVKLQLRELGARYGGKTVLRDITTPLFEGGKVVAVIGPNAAGKSTLFKRIAGFLPGPGEIVLAHDTETGNAVCYMPQDIAANAVLTVFESVLLARKQGASWSVDPQDIQAVESTLAALRIAALGPRNIGELSGGQLQLVGIAQALVCDPQVLLMDEPTSALDMSRRVEVLSFLRSLARERGMLVFIALHDLNDALRYSDSAMVIADGRLVACGPTDRMITEELLHEVYRVRARVETCSRGIRHVLIDGPIGDAFAPAGTAA